MKLVDVGVWLAAVWGRHVHHPVAADWFGREADDEPAGAIGAGY